MIEINYDENMLAQVERKLGQMKSEAPKALKNAINQTAKQARKDLAIEAQKTYTVKTGRFNKAMKIKAFVTKFSSGHVAVVQRRGEERTPIKTFSTNSIPVMLKNERRVYGVVKPHIMQNLKQNVEIQVRKILEG